MPYVATLITIAAALWTSGAQAGDSDDVRSAVQFLRMACVTGEKLEIEGSTDGGFALFKKGLSGEFRFSKKEVSGFVDTLNDQIKSEQADKIRECMKPYTGKILNIILGDGT